MKIISANSIIMRVDRSIVFIVFIFCIFARSARATHKQTNKQTNQQTSIFIDRLFRHKRKIKIEIALQFLLIRYDSRSHSSLICYQWIERKTTHTLHLEVVMTWREKKMKEIRCAALFSTNIQCHRFFFSFCMRVRRWVWASRKKNKIKQNE